MASRVATLPQTLRKLVCTRLTTNFAEATELVTCPMPTPKPKEVLIKTSYVGVNATDINITAGRYQISSSLPFDTGLEALGEIVAVGSEIKHLKAGQPVTYLGFGCYADYLCVPAYAVWTVPSINPEFLALIISGRTAAISLDKQGMIKKNDKVLITAAAGGAGSIAVQYAKKVGCHVIGTCSTDEKVQVLKDLKCDRPINYRKENLDTVLSSEYPDGVDVVFESVGGEVFKTCLKNLATRGRLVIIGYISQYQSEVGYQPLDLGHLPQQLLTHSGTVSGFMLTHYQDEFQYYHVKLLGMHEQNKFKLFIDQGENTEGGPFVGLESVARAIEYLHKGISKGKVIVKMPN